MKKANLTSIGFGIIIASLLLAFNTPEKATVKYDYKQVATLE